MYNHYNTTIQFMMLFQYLASDEQLFVKITQHLNKDTEFRARRALEKEKHSEAEAFNNFISHSQALLQIHAVFDSKKHFSIEDVVVGFIRKLNSWLCAYKRGILSGSLQGIVVFPANFGQHATALDSLFYQFENKPMPNIHRMKFMEGIL